MLKKVYVEITNHCNLDCVFCPKTRREKRTMSVSEFEMVLDRLRGQVKYIYLHVMGEPLLHPQLEELLDAAQRREMKVCITTNGTLLPQREEILLAAPCLHKISVSLHSFEGNERTEAEQRAYLEGVWHFADAAAKRGIIVALRLWNEGGLEKLNPEVLAFLREKLGTDEWAEKRGGSFTLRERLYLERAKKFDWPERDGEETGTQFCYGLRDQLGILVDGTVVPCCLDHEGDIALGNLFTEPPEEILNSPRARAMADGFSCRRPSEELCRRCGYATRFNK